MDSKYEKLERIGEGAYGVVYKAKDKQTGDLVALKRIRLDSDEEGVPCTAIREISLLKELRHDNIVRLLDVVHSDRKLTLVFEYLEQDLKKFMDQCGNDLEPKLVQHFLRQLLLGIEYCHQRSVLHRDLKPHNLLISKDKDLKLADFGLGRAFGIPVRKYTHEVVTLWYRSPDVLLGNTSYGTPVDIWSVGCIFGEMAVGAPLFAGKNDADQLMKVFQFLGTPNRELWPSMNTYPNSGNMLSRQEFLTDYAPLCETKFRSPEYAKIGPTGCDLLRRMLHYEPSQRITATEALKHPYFSERF